VRFCCSFDVLQYRISLFAKNLAAAPKTLIQAGPGEGKKKK
jgi:hypothetical protein